MRHQSLTVFGRGPCEPTYLPTTWPDSDDASPGNLICTTIWISKSEVKILYPIRHKIAHFRDVLPNESLSAVLKIVTHTHMHTHTHLTALFPWLPGWANTRKENINLDFTEARDNEWQWYQLGHMQVCTSLQADNHASTPPFNFFYRPDCHSCRPSNKCQSTEGTLMIVNPTQTNQTRIRWQAGQKMPPLSTHTCTERWIRQKHNASGGKQDGWWRHKTLLMHAVLNTMPESEAHAVAKRQNNSTCY